MASVVDSMTGVDHALGTVRRQRERRLRAYLRHARMRVAVPLAEAKYHTAPRGQRTARAREEERDEHYTAAFRTPEPELFHLHEEPRGGRPDLLLEPQRPQTGFSGTSRSILRTLLPWCKFSMFLCRIREKSWRTS